MEPTSSTPSASPEADFEEALIGVDPDDEQVVKIGPVTFTLPPMTALQWEELSGKQITIRNAALARAITILTARGEDPNEPLPGQGERATLVKADAQLVEDMDYRKVQNETMLQAVVWSLKSHSKFKDRKGNAFPCTHGEDGFLDAKTRALYARNIDIVQKLWLTMVRLNTLDVTGKKSSR